MYTVQVKRAPFLVAAVVFGLGACSGGIKSTQKTRLTTKQIVDVSKPGIVRVESEFGPGQTGVGTGFVVSAEGRVVTNMHVLFDVQSTLRVARRVSVILLDGSRHEVVRVVSADAQRDLAVLEIAAKHKLTALPIGDSDQMSAGDRIIAIGNPLGVLDYTVSDGLISSVRPVSEDLTMLQISAPISQGSSGGPLFNNYGEVIGVATAISREGQNLNFAIPSNYLRPMLVKQGGLTLAELGQKFTPPNPNGARPDPNAPRIQRNVPNHDLSLLDGCSDASLNEAVEAVGNAIANGAPIYNSGNHEGCYRIYEGTSLRLDRESSCKGVRDALGQGLLRASTLGTFTEKAWAMRDAFDGLLDVIARKARAAGNAP